MANSPYPLPNFHFVVQWGGTRIGFSEVTGLDMQAEAIEYREGSSPQYSKIKMPKSLKLDSSVNLNELSAKYELSGASILNAVYFSALQCYSRSSDTLTQTDLINGIRKEFLKEEKSI